MKYQRMEKNWGYSWLEEWPLIGPFTDGPPARPLPSFCLLHTPVMKNHPARMFCSPTSWFQWGHPINKASRCQSWSTFSQQWTEEEDLISQSLLSLCWLFFFLRWRPPAWFALLIFALFNSYYVISMLFALGFGWFVFWCFYS